MAKSHWVHAEGWEGSISSQLKEVALCKLVHSWHCQTKNVYSNYA